MGTKPLGRKPHDVCGDGRGVREAFRVAKAARGLGRAALPRRTRSRAGLWPKSVNGQPMQIP